MLGKKLELQWTNKDKSLFYDISTGQYEWVHKKDPRVSEPRILGLNLAKPKNSAK
jgi:hypothetical protein